MQRKELGRKEKQELGRIWELGRILHRENEELRKIWKFLGRGRKEPVV